MAIEAIGLDQIHDNPYQARLTYHKKDIDDLAHSIETHGLLQVPPGRRIDGNVELGFGHLRKRAFAKLAKKEPEKFGQMPVDIRNLTDEQMAMFSLEENLKRAGLTPLETARAVDQYLNSFPGKTEVELAESLNMTKGNVSNMRRVLRLPEKILEKIDGEVITFHQGRELLIFERFENADNLMRAALDSLKTGNKSYGETNTVEGLQRSIHSVISGHCRPLDKEWEGYRWDILYDTRAAGCLECEKMVRTHPTKSATAHFCNDAECWDRLQEEHREKAAVEAKARMEAEILRAAAATAMELLPKKEPPKPEPAYKIEKRGTTWIAIDGQDEVIAIAYDKKLAEEIAKASFEPVATEVNPNICLLNHTYRFIEKRGSPQLPTFDVTAQDLAAGAKALGVDPGNIEQAKVYKSSGKLGTAGGVSAGWSKCTESLKLEEPPAEISKRIAGTPAPQELPCDTCLNNKTCAREHFHVAQDGGQLVCGKWESDQVSWTNQPEIPEELLKIAREAAGTRAEVLDLKDIGASYGQEVGQGYALLEGWSRPLEHILDPEECLERCTHGFHFAFDSRQREARTVYVCSDTKCLANKKAAFTRAKNAEGQARKKAEIKAIKEAIAQTTTLDRPCIKLILLAQMDGHHTSRHYYGPTDGKQPETWLWEKISAGTPAIDRKRQDLFKRIDKLTDEELAKLVVEFMFYYLTDKGDIGTYQIKTTEPLKWMGIEIKVEPDGVRDHA